MIFNDSFVLLNYRTATVKSYAGNIIQELFRRTARRKTNRVAPPAKSDPSNLPQSFAIIACQRSGTHMLREILNSNPHIALLGEPLTFDDRRETWHNFLKTVHRKRQPIMHVAQASLLFDEYMQSLRRHYITHPDIYGGRKKVPTWVGLDIKYNQIKCVNPLYTDLRTRPFLLDHFRDRRFHIIHLVRNNVLHQAISIMVANRRQVWRNENKRKIEGLYLLAPTEVINYMHWIRLERNNFEEATKGDKVQTIAYEDIVSDIASIQTDGTFPEMTTVLAPIAALLQVPNKFHYNDVLPKVLNRPYAEFIENHAEVVAAVKANYAFSHFADTI